MTEHSDVSVIRKNWLTRPPSDNALFVVLVLIFFISLISLIYWKNFWNLAPWLPTSPDLVFVNNQWWRPWTALLIHADFNHLISNLLMFSVFGFFLNGHFGSGLFPGLSFFMGGITNILTMTTMPHDHQLLGLSSVVFWLGGSWLSLYFFIENRKTTQQKLLRVFGVTLALFLPSEAFDPRISYWAHAIGFLSGLAVGVIYYWIHRSHFAEAVEIHYFIEELPFFGTRT